MSDLSNEISFLRDLLSVLTAELSAVKIELSAVKHELSLVKLENLDLKNQLGLNSSNSHKPPSSDSPSIPPKIPQVARGKGGKVGGQKGHKGNNLKMVSADQLDHILEHTPTVCNGCGTPLCSTNRKLSESRQVFELPAPKLVITEHRAFRCQCGKCGYSNLADFPVGVNSTVQYGSGAKAFATLLNQHFLLPFAKVSEFYKLLFGQSFNVSTLQSSNESIYAGLETTESAIKKAIESSEVAHFDETGLHINGKLNWLHVASTPQYTYYFSHARRGTPALADTPSVLPNFKGIAIHDCWSSYFKFDKCQHALCNAHLLRELQAALENGYTWAAALQERFKKLLHLKETAELTSQIFKEQRKKLDRQLQNIQDELEAVKEKGTKVFKKTKALIARMRQHLDKFLAFAKHQNVPFTNNLAERDIRMVKLKIKISGGFRTEKGAAIFARIRGVISTARKLNKNVLQILKNAIQKQTQKNIMELT